MQSVIRELGGTTIVSTAISTEFTTMVIGKYQSYGSMADGVEWRSWKYGYSARRAEMKLREENL